MIRVLMADDHGIVRRGLRDILGDHPDLTLVAEAGDYPSLLALVEEHDADVVVMDIRMPGGNALDALSRMAAKRPELPVLVLSAHPEDQFALRLLKSGASGYVAKDSAPIELVAAIRALADGRRYLSSELTEQLASVYAGAGDEPLHARLSDREFQVFRLIASGRTVGEIAEELFLSVKTVSTYRARLLRKMGFSNNAELTRYAFEHGLVD
ncbi:MAG: response regulator transcription factor [Longimicrobiales bacterium]